MEEETLFTARDAALLTRNSDKEAITQQLNEIIDMIIESANGGESAVDYNDTILPAVKRQLELRGFGVQFSTNPEKQWYTISWMA